MLIDVADSAGQNLGSIFHKIRMIDLAKMENIGWETFSLFSGSGCPVRLWGGALGKVSKGEKQHKWVGSKKVDGKEISKDCKIYTQT